MGNRKGTRRLYMQVKKQVRAIYKGQLPAFAKKRVKAVK